MNPLTGLNDYLKRKVQLQIREQELMNSLMAISRQPYLEDYLRHVELREAEFVRWWAATPENRPDTPRIAALESVIHDVMRGWL